jgi:hypothetical protein
MQHAAFIDGLLHVPSEGPMLALVDGSTGGYDIGKRQLRAIINAVGEKAWAEGNRFSLRLATHDDPAFAQQVTRLIRTISRRRNWGGIKAPPNPHPLIMGRISGQRNLSADRIAGASSGAAGRIRGVVQVALHQTRILLNEMTPDGIRNYVALRAAARDGASAEDIARLALEFSGASAAQDRTGRFARTVAPLRRISEEILGAQEAGPITGPGGPR